MEDNNLTKLELRKIKAKERMRRLRKNRNEQKRKLIQENDTNAHRQTRLERRRLKRERDLNAHRLAREDEERRHLERERDLNAHRLAREDEERRQIEQLSNTDAHRLARLDAERRQQERIKDCDAHRFARENEERRLLERERDSEAHRYARLNEERRNSEREKDSDAHCIARSNLKRRQKERGEDRIARKLARIDLKNAITFKDLCVQYEKNIKNGPTIVCNSCCGLFFQSSINTLKIESVISNEIENEFLTRTCDTSNEKLKFCINCYRDIKQLKIPTLSKANGFGFPTIPSELQNMSEVEIRLVSPRIPFMQITELSKRDRQYGIKDNVVNVPISVDTSCSILPRTFDNTHTIQLKLKRKICYQSFYMYETVRPAECYNAVKYLIDTPLYQMEKIIISDNWLNEHSNENENFIILNEDKVNEYTAVNQINGQNTNADEWDEENEENNISANDTLWTDNDFAKTISFAPVEGKYPLSIIRDQYSEELSFPNIYCGQPRQVKNNISYANIWKWELRHYDRRCCYIPKIFFMLKKRQIQMITKQASIYLRKRKNNENITAGQLLDKEFIDNVCKVDDGYKFLKVDRHHHLIGKQEKKKY